MARYNTDGSLDTTFDSDGKLTTDFGGNNDRANSVAIQNSGKIVVTGEGNGDFALARYNPEDGSLDITFGTDGKLTTDFNTGYDKALSVVIQGDGNIVVAGSGENSAGAYYTSYALARYKSAPCLDGYQLKQGENICIPGTPASDPGDYPDIMDRNYVQGDISTDSNRTADDGLEGEYPPLCRDVNSTQGAYSSCP